MTDANDFENFLTPYVNDHAMHGSFRARYPKLIEMMKTLVSEDKQATRKTYGHFPANAAMIQVTLYDNWQGNTPPNKNFPFARYGMDVKAWMTPPQTQKAWYDAAWHGECRNLWYKNDVTAKAKGTFKNQQQVLSDLQVLKDNDFGNIGVMHHQLKRKLPTLYFPDHYATLDFGGNGPLVRLFMGDCVYEVSGFVTTAPNRAPLTNQPKMAKAIGQVRHTATPLMVGGFQWGVGAVQPPQ